MRSDEGLRFHAILQKADGATHTRETDNRLELLAWMNQHQDTGDVVIEVGTTATGPAVKAMIAALVFGASKLVRVGHD